MNKKYLKEINKRDQKDYLGFEAYEKYIQWSKFKENYPYNTELLIELFGEVDAMDVFMIMITIPEPQAKQIVGLLKRRIVAHKKIQNMSHS